VGRNLYNLAELYREKGQYDQAEPRFVEACSILEQAEGLEHPDVATSLNYLAQLLQATNRISEAEPMMRRALAIDEKSYGQDHPNVARDLNNLARLLKDTNRLSAAEPLMRRHLPSIYRRHRPRTSSPARGYCQLRCLAWRDGP